MFTTVYSYGQNLIDWKDATQSANTVIENLDTKLTQLTQSSVSSGNFVIEQRLNQVGYLFESLKSYITNERIKTLEQLDANIINELHAIDLIINNNIDKFNVNLENLSNDLITNLDVTLNKLPSYLGGKKSVIIRDIKGMDQIFNSTQDYTLIIKSNMFSNSDFKPEIIIDGIHYTYTLKNNDIEAIIEIPNVIFKAKFQDYKVTRIPFKIICSKKKFFKTKILYERESSISLLPKYPIQYKIEEVSNSYSWGPAQEGKKIKIQTDINGGVVDLEYNIEDESKKIDLSSTKWYNPKAIHDKIYNKDKKDSYHCHHHPHHNYLQIKRPNKTGEHSIDRNVISDCKSWLKMHKDRIGDWVSDAVILNNGQGIRRSYIARGNVNLGTDIHHSQTIWGIIYYKNRITNEEKQSISLNNNLKKGYITFGSTYLSESLSKEHVSYQIQIKFFFQNEWTTLTNAFSHPYVTHKYNDREKNTIAVKINPYMGI